jgi:hypothetical protein
MSLSLFCCLFIVKGGLPLEFGMILEVNKGQRAPPLLVRIVFTK